MTLLSGLSPVQRVYTSTVTLFLPVMQSSFGISVNPHSKHLEVNISQYSRIGARAGRARGAAAPPKFWATQIFWAARENLDKTSFLRRFRVF